jgi:hypothetical protein
VAPGNASATAPDPAPAVRGIWTSSVPFHPYTSAGTPGSGPLTVSPPAVPRQQDGGTEQVGRPRRDERLGRGLSVGSVPCSHWASPVVTTHDAAATRERTPS